MPASKAQRIDCANNLSAMMRLMKDKVGYDEDDIIFLIRKWVRVGATFPGIHDPSLTGRNYAKLFKKWLAHFKVTAKSVELVSDDVEWAKEKASQALYRLLGELSNRVYIPEDLTYGFILFQKVDGVFHTMVWNYRVRLFNTDAELSKAFEKRLSRLQSELEFAR